MSDGKDMVLDKTDKISQGAPTFQSNINQTIRWANLANTQERTYAADVSLLGVAKPMLLLLQVVVVQPCCSRQRWLRYRSVAGQGLRGG